ncbi:hypothetical protein U1Q18_018386 [Sarracenia purpurea var. burkii]
MHCNGRSCPFLQAKKVAAKPETVAAATRLKTKGATPPVKTKKDVMQPKSVSKPKNIVKTTPVTSLAKKVATPAAVKAKKPPGNAVKKPKSMKSPVKKVPAKKGKKAMYVLVSKGGELGLWFAQFRTIERTAHNLV